MKPYVVIIIVVLVIALGVGGYFWMKKNNSKNTSTSEKPALEKNGSSALDSSPTDLSQEFLSASHGVSFKYPSLWKSKDIDGDKNVTSPLTRENIAYLYEPVSSSDKALSTMELLRFVIEPNETIKSVDDWYNYIKAKVDKFVGQKDLTDEVGYNLISLEKVDDINGKWTVREDYTLKDNVRGRDYYIYTGDIYQFVFEVNQSDFTSYEQLFKNIAYSFNIK